MTVELLLLRGLVALLADFAVLRGLDAARMFAGFAFFLGLVAAGIGGANEGDAAEESERGEEGGDGLHVVCLSCPRLARDFLLS